jgi:hypothetical protein
MDEASYQDGDAFLYRSKQQLQACHSRCRCGFWYKLRGSFAAVIGPLVEVTMLISLEQVPYNTKAIEPKRQIEQSMRENRIRGHFNQKVRKYLSNQNGIGVIFSPEDNRSGTHAVKVLLYLLTLSMWSAFSILSSMEGGLGSGAD